jgi:peptide/nickel transport system substrate-binding protein
MKAPTTEQPKLWNDLDQEILTKYLPVIPQWYTGIAQTHGSKIQGHFDDTTLGQPTYKNIWVSQ